MKDDPRVQQAREHHREAAGDEASAARHRAERDRLIREVREDDPDEWSYGNLGRGVGCSRELVWHICHHQQ
jgi:hypothetical protein